MATRETILVVEDEAALLGLYVEWLDTAPFHVETAGTGRDALDLFDDTVDIVLLDRRLPDISGDEVLQRIRDQGCSCKVVMVTGADADEAILEQEFDAYLTKPVFSDELIETIEQMRRRRDYNACLDEYFTVVSRLVAAEQSSRDLSQIPAVKQLRKRKSELRAQMIHLEDAFTTDDFAATMQDIDRSAVTPSG